MATLREGTYGAYYGSTYNESAPLSEEEMEINAQYIYHTLSGAGWSLNGIAALIGNMTAESSLNPGRWQSDDVGNLAGGYGLVQWTPATNYIDWATAQGFSDVSTMDNNISRILYEVENGLQWIAKDSFNNMTFSEFSKSSDDVATLTKAFMLCYERPADQSEEAQEKRAALGVAWYIKLGGLTPEGPTISTSEKRKGYNFIFLKKRRAELWKRKKFLS